MKYSFDLDKIKIFERDVYSLREKLIKSSHVLNVYRKTPSEKILYDKYGMLSKDLGNFSQELSRYLNERYAYNSFVEKEYSSAVIRSSKI